MKPLGPLQGVQSLTRTAGSDPHGYRALWKENAVRHASRDYRHRVSEFVDKNQLRSDEHELDKHIIRIPASSESKQQNVKFNFTLSASSDLNRVRVIPISNSQPAVRLVNMSTPSTSSVKITELPRTTSFHDCLNFADKSSSSGHSTRSGNSVTDVTADLASSRAPNSGQACAANLEHVNNNTDILLPAPIIGDGELECELTDTDDCILAPPPLFADSCPDLDNLDTDSLLPLHDEIPASILSDITELEACSTESNNTKLDEDCQIIDSNTTDISDDTRDKEIIAANAILNLGTDQMVNLGQTQLVFPPEAVQQQQLVFTQSTPGGDHTFFLAQAPQQTQPVVQIGQNTGSPFQLLFLQPEVPAFVLPQKQRAISPTQELINSYSPHRKHG